MDPVRNPYNPGAGRRPAELVGRDEQLREWRIGVERVMQGRTAQPQALYGLRGVGKTVLLKEFERSASTRGWIVAAVEAATDKPLRMALGEAFHAPLLDLAKPSAGARMRKALKTLLSFKASYDATGNWNFGLDLHSAPGGGADTGMLESDLGTLIHDLSGAAAERQVGLAILVDEAQDLAKDELTALCSIIHRAGQDEWPVLFALAGLPSLPRVLAEGKSYAERLFSFSALGRLSDPMSFDALKSPAADEGVAWEFDALKLLATESGGYPYFLQQFGQDTWNAAVGPVIRVADARAGMLKGQSALDAGFFRTRWQRASRHEQEFLRAMAQQGEKSCGITEVAERLGREPKAVYPTRSNLIAKGLVYVPVPGVVAFTVPGMADFIQRHRDD